MSLSVEIKHFLHLVGKEYLILNEERILKTKEVIEILGLGKTKTYQLLQNHIIPATQVGHQYLVIESELFKWLKSNIDNKIEI